MTLAYTPKIATTFSIAADATWTDYDLYTLQGVPKGAIAEIVCANKNTGAARTAGVRADGSGLDRYIYLHEAEGDGVHTVTMFVKCHETTGLIECYSEIQGDVEFYLLGYFDSGTGFTEKFVSLGTPGTSWTEKDLSGSGVPANAVVQIMMANGADAADYFAGVREVGSGLERGVTLDEAEDGAKKDGGLGWSVLSMVVKANASSTIEWKAGSATDVEMWLLGWFSVNVNFTEGFNDYSPSSDETWTSKTITQAPVSSVVAFAMVHEDSGVQQVTGLREEGSSQVRTITEHEAEGGSSTGFQACIQLDASKKCEVYLTDASEGLFAYTGYFETIIFTKEFTADIVLQKTDKKEFTADVVAAEIWYCTLNGTIVATEGNCVERGFEWDTDSGTPYANSWTEEGDYGTGTFSHQITGLILGETYYFRTKARNGGGWGYGTEKSVVFGGETYTKNFTSDIVLVDRLTETITADILLQEIDKKEFTGDIALVDRLSKTFTADITLVDREVKTFTADILVQKTDKKEITADILLLKTDSKGFTADIVLVDRLSKDFIADTLLLKTGSETVTADIALVDREAKTFTSDVVLQLVPTRTFDADIVLVDRKSKTFTTDIVLVDRLDKTLTGDIVLVDRLSREFMADILLLKSDVETITADTVLLKTQAKSIAGDTVLVDRLSKPFTADIVLVDRQTETITADVTLVDREVKTFTVDVVTAGLATRTKTFTADIIVSSEEIERQRGVRLITREAEIVYMIKGDLVIKREDSFNIMANTLGQELTMFAKILSDTLVSAESRTKLISSVSIPFSITKVIISDTIVPNIISFGTRANTLVRVALSLPVRGIVDMRRLIMEIVLEEE